MGVIYVPFQLAKSMVPEPRARGDIATVECRVKDRYEVENWPTREGQKHWPSGHKNILKGRQGHVDEIFPSYNRSKIHIQGTGYN